MIRLGPTCGTAQIDPDVHAVTAQSRLERHDSRAYQVPQLTELDIVEVLDVGDGTVGKYGFTEPLPASYPIWFALGAGLAYMVGAAVPLLITYFAPVAIETRAILAAVVVSLALSSVVAARAGRMVSRRVLARTIIVGLLTLAVSYVAGELLLS